MKNSEQSSVYGLTAKGPKVTLAAAVLVAAIVSVPVFLILSVFEWIWL
ncbi:hypothetical protein [Shimia isoporae]|nr:hypothetical protein [Shimia isoporae]